MPTPQPQNPITQNWVDIRQPAMAGLNTIVDVHDIKDQEAPDMLNVMFDMGVIGNRTGSTLYSSKPSGETGNPLQLMIAKTSDGIQYLISVYTSGTNVNNFYLWDTVNSQWIQINGSYAPVFSKILYFGSQNWNYGFGDDRLYFGNGYDDTGRWRVNLNYLAIASASTDTTITLTDASRFYLYTAVIANSPIANNAVVLNTSPQANTVYTNEWELGQMVYYIGSGITGLTTNTLYYAIPTTYSLPLDGTSGNSLGFATTLANAVAGNFISISGTPSGTNTVYKAEPLILQNGVTTYSAIYYNKSGNVLTLTGAIGSIIPVGSAVATTITDRPGVKKGKILVTWNSRLVSANFSPGGENTMFVSRVSEPEDFTMDTDDISSGGFQVFNDGAQGGITDIKDYGEFLVVAKSNIIYRFSFVQNQDLSAQFPQIVPIISGIGMGPQNQRSSTKALNSIYYPSSSSGFIALSPLNTGFTASTGLQVISFNINNFIQNGLDFSNSKGAFFQNKLLWTFTSQNLPNSVLVYDTIRQAWTKFDSWNPADMAIYNNKFYFLSSTDGNIYQGLTGYTDNGNQYNSSFQTKLNNFGKPSMVKTISAIYVEGYMTQSTTLYADVLYNEKGKLLTQTYKLTNGVTGFQFSNVNIDALGMIPFNQGILDSLTPSQLQLFGYFRGFLSVPQAYGLFAVQIKFYSSTPNGVWFITGYGFNPQYENMIPPGMLIDAVNPVVINF